jgi:hypothetical protein
MRILRWLGIALVSLATMVVGIGVVARFSDGPIGPFPGGKLTSGALVTEADIDWSLAIEGKGEAQVMEPRFIELQLVDPPVSRTTGVMLYEGQPYVPCDLGFVWRRVPAPPRWMLSLIYRFKRWHQDVLLDGRVVLRIGGKRYERQAVRVADPELLTALRSEVETGASKMLGAPLGAVPTDGPRDIWFFRMEPRLSAEARPGGA